MRKHGWFRPHVRGLTAISSTTLREGVGVSAPDFYEDDMTVAFDSIFGALESDRSASLLLLGDSTGNEVDDWFYRMLDEKIAPRFSDLHIMHRLWSDAAQDYSLPTEVQSAASGQRYLTSSDGTEATVRQADMAVSAGTDLEVTIDVSIPDWTPGTDCRLCGVWTTTGNQRSWMVVAYNTGVIQYFWSPDGTNSNNVLSSPHGIANGARKRIRVRHDVNNGAGGHTITIDVAEPNSDTWTNVYNTATGAGTTAVYASTGPLEIFKAGGSFGSSGAKIYDLDLRNGIEGARRSPVMIEDFRAADATKVTPGGAPTLYVYNGSHAGSDISYHDDSLRRARITPMASVQAIFLNHAQNVAFSYASLKQFGTVWATWVDNVRALCPTASIVALNGNPRDPAGTTGPDSLLYQVHAVLGVLQTKGVPVINTQRAYQRALDRGAAFSDLISGVHPTKPAGVNVWLDEVWRLAQQRLS